jgi:hypothetical protein
VILLELGCVVSIPLIDHSCFRVSFHGVMLRLTRKSAADPPEPADAAEGVVGRTYMD